IDYRPLAKLAYAEEFVGDTERRTAAYSSVREDSSTGSTHKLPAEVEFCKRSINKCKFFTLGTMIELPRAALKAGEIAEELDYFSFGTNDLTQTTYGISRDDVASFFPDYLEKKIFAFDPFSKLDEEGVGELIKIAIKRGLKSNPTLKLGVCGEHAGNPHSIEFFHRVGLHYVSCSPYRIPIARIAAAQATIKADGYQS
ncbi:MAG: palindromic element RPE1 domain-containing protein, partial [Rickettsia endosymbiont of Labidopullus appendiculatus]|nr:palindromic element RPE1 domain-containing protein [Rickettsia endosymbiont of Labidopullus appendiculatus]